MFNSEQKIVTKRAIAYYRHSAEDKQENSVPIQRGLIKNFARKYEIELIHEEADEGKSGLLGPKGRPGFKRLFDNWINNENAPNFDYVLVLDESRWGRFQNLNEAGHYVYNCNERGKVVVYVANGILPKGNELEGYLTSGIKQYMSAQYAVQLSEKVFGGCIKVSEQGYSAGGTACYGMARQLLDVEKKPVGILKKGEHKAISNARVRFIPANDKTTETVNRIFNLFVIKLKNIKEIAEELNYEKIPSANGGKWNTQKILRILTNETYLGTRLYNKTQGKLKQRRQRNPRNLWVIVPQAFRGIVEPEIFRMAQERLSELIPSRWEKGIYATRKAERIILQELEHFFLVKNLQGDDISMTIRQFPIIYSVPYIPNSTISYWCFVIPDKLRRHSFVFGVGISTDKDHPIDRIFVIPTNEFGQGDFCLFSEKDGVYERYYVKEAEVEKKVLDLVQELGITIS